jgi:hypothetical protein
MSSTVFLIRSSLWKIGYISLSLPTLQEHRQEDYGALDGP